MGGSCLSRAYNHKPSLLYIYILVFKPMSNMVYHAKLKFLSRLPNHSNNPAHQPNHDEPTIHDTLHPCTVIYTVRKIMHQLLRLGRLRSIARQFDILIFKFVVKTIFKGSGRQCLVVKLRLQYFKEFF